MDFCRPTETTPVVLLLGLWVEPPIIAPAEVTGLCVREVCVGTSFDAVNDGFVRVI